MPRTRLDAATPLRAGRVLVAGLVLVTLVSFAHADWIELQSGTLVRGEIAFASDTHTYVRLADGSLVALPRQDLVAVEGELPLYERLERVESYLRNERHDRALRHVRIARRQHPTHPEVNLAYIRCRIARGETDLALEAARIAGIVHPEHMRLQLVLAELLTGVDAFDRATEILRTLRERLREMRPGRRAEPDPEVVALTREAEIAWQRLLERRRQRQGDPSAPAHEPGIDPHYDPARYSDPIAADLGNRMLAWAKGFSPQHANCFQRLELELRSNIRYRTENIDDYKDNVHTAYLNVIVNRDAWFRIEPGDGGLSPEEEDRNFRERSIIVHGLLRQILHRFDGREKVTVIIRVLAPERRRDRFEELWNTKWDPSERGVRLEESYRNNH